MGVLADPAEVKAAAATNISTRFALVEVDRRHIANGKAGKVLKEASDLYFDVCRGVGAGCGAAKRIGE